MADEDWKVVIDQDSSSKNSLGIKIMFVIFLLTLIAELIYFFYIVPNKKIITTIIPTAIPTIAEKIISPATSNNKAQEYQGKITKIIANNYELTSDVYMPILMFSIEGISKTSSESSSINFVFNKNEINKVIVKDNLKQNISYMDLKLGQYIKMTEVYDYKKNIFQKYEITIIE